MGGTDFFGSGWKTIEPTELPTANMLKTLLKRQQAGNGDAPGWFSTIQDFEELDLDIVGILAILGEGDCTVAAKLFGPF